MAVLCFLILYLFFLTHVTWGDFNLNFAILLLCEILAAVSFLESEKEIENFEAIFIQNVFL